MSSALALLPIVFVACLLLSRMIFDGADAQGPGAFYLADSRAPDVPGTHKPPEHDAGTLVAELLKQKESEYPWYAEYELDFSPAAGPAGRKVRLQFFSADPTMFYSDELMEVDASRILLRNGRYHWEYDDSSLGRWGFTGPAPIKDVRPSAFLESRDFVHNVFSELDASIVSQISRWFRGARVETRDGVTTATADVRGLGQITISISPGSLDLQTLHGPGKTLLRYRYGREKPRWAEQHMKALLDRFQVDPESTRATKSPEEFSFLALMAAVWEEGSAKPIELERLSDVAARYGYSVPTVGEVVSAQAVLTYRPGRSMTVNVRHAGRQYAITQYRPGMTLQDLGDYVRNQRPLGDYRVVDVHDVGTGADFTYYLGDRVTLVVDGSRFSDEALDALISSFRLPRRELDSSTRDE